MASYKKGHINILKVTFIWQVCRFKLFGRKTLQFILFLLILLNFITGKICHWRWQFFLLLTLFLILSFGMLSLSQILPLPVPFWHLLKILNFSCFYAKCYKNASLEKHIFLYILCVRAPKNYRKSMHEKSLGKIITWLKMCTKWSKIEQGDIQRNWESVCAWAIRKSRLCKCTYVCATPYNIKKKVQSTSMQYSNAVFLLLCLIHCKSSLLFLS